jgi:dihydrofolate reductase
MAVKIAMIAALDEQNGIGKGNDLPWHLPDDFKWFKDKTFQHPVIMGRKTMQALRKPLKGRDNLVLTRNPESILEGFQFCESLDNALEKAREVEDDEIFVIGGAEIYKQMLPSADRLYLTHVHATLEGTDAFFPEFDKSEWNVSQRIHHPVDERHKYSFDIVVYDRKTI